MNEKTKATPPQTADDAPAAKAATGCCRFGTSVHHGVTFDVCVQLANGEKPVWTPGEC